MATFRSKYKIGQTVWFHPFRGDHEAVSDEISGVIFFGNGYIHYMVKNETGWKSEDVLFDHKPTEEEFDKWFCEYNGW